MAKFYRSPARCNGGKNAQTSLGLGVGPFDGHDASLGQEKEIGDQGGPLNIFKICFSKIQVHVTTILKPKGNK